MYCGNVCCWGCEMDDKQSGERLDKKDNSIGDHYLIVLGHAMHGGIYFASSEWFRILLIDGCGDARHWETLLARIAE